MAQDSVPTPSGSVLSVRVSAEERALLESAASLARTSLSDFVRRAAMQDAELAVLDRRVITIPAEKWDEFEAWLEAPMEPGPALVELMNHKPVWEK